MRLLFPELVLVQLRVHAARGDELLMRAALGDAILREDDNLVRIFDGGEPVRHNDAGAPVGKVVERLLDEHFRGVVERARGLIQNQDGGVLQEHHRQILSLPNERLKVQRDVRRDHRFCQECI